jgi:enoyl-CoA hydratase/carnithine racemase
MSGERRSDPVLYDVRGSGAWLTINRPDRRNALNAEVIQGLLSALRRAQAEESIRCVVLTGAGDRAFCAGADLAMTMITEGGRTEHEDGPGRIAELLLALGRHPQPVVARVNGAALAGGFGLMLACDLVVAAEDAEMGTPEVNVGLWPHMISAVIIRNAPRKIALELMMTGRRLSSSDAERWGLVNRVVPRERLDVAVGELVEELAGKSPVVLRLGKESYARAQDMPLEEALAYLQSMLAENLGSEDALEGVSAFLQKRRPEWKGR